MGNASQMMFVGLMSGTSCDGIDAALVEVRGQSITCVATHYHAYPDELKSRLLKVIAGFAFSAREFSDLDYHLALAYVEVVQTLLEQSGISADQITSIGMHGQTIDHNPPLNTWQLGSASHVAALTGIDVVADFRSVDVAMGGQGAPLAPALHQALFFQGEPLAVLNLGGIANISYLNNDGFIGFDTGPANCLMDLWIKLHRNVDYDESGMWAASGTSHQGLLESMLGDLYFSQSPPKSTGRELFNESWLARHLASYSEVSVVDVQASLLQLTVLSIVKDIKQHAPDAQKLIVCGGGVHNTVLMNCLSDNLSIPVVCSKTYGTDPDHVESVLMGWLAACYPKPIDLTDVTGAPAPHVFGVRYLA